MPLPRGLLKQSLSAVIYLATDDGKRWMVDPGLPARRTERGEFQRVADLLGGASILRRPVTNSLEAHELILGGLPGKALSHLVGRFTVIQQTPSLEKAIGMSLRTFQRRTKSSAKPLSQEQSGRTWKLAEILAKATAMFGSQQDAERWLESPAMGLNGRRPMDLLATPAGVQIVENFLTQLEYGVYV